MKKYLYKNALKKEIILKIQSFGYREIGIIFEKFHNNNFHKFKIYDLITYKNILNFDDLILVDYFLLKKEICSKQKSVLDNFFYKFRN